MPVVPPAYRLNSFLGFVPLQRGCVIIGSIYVLYHMIIISITLKYLLDYELAVRQCLRKDDFFTMSTNSSSGEDAEMEDVDSKVVPLNHDQGPCHTEQQVVAVRMVSGISAGISFLYMLIAMMMIYGALKKKPRMMTLWLVLLIVTILFSLLSFRLFSLLPNIFSLLVVSSYYFELRESEERRVGGVTVVAVTRSPNDMMVVIPTVPKDDPPPPYPGFTPGVFSASNPVYNPNGADLPADYLQHMPSTLPPEYTSLDCPPPPPAETTQTPLPNDNNNLPPSFSSLNVSPYSPQGSANEGGGEALHAVEERPQPQLPKN